MRRELPERPHLDHLKAQAKDLLDLQRRADPGALARIRAALPELRHAPDEHIARARFALHDAQSAIAREYGFPSWAKLRAHVLAAAAPYPEKLIATLFGAQLGADVQAALRDIWAKRDLEALDRLPTPEHLPVLAVRNALLTPGALAPFAIGRPVSVAALERAERTEPSLVAVFAQRDEAVTAPSADELHGTGCLALVRRFQRQEGAAWVVLEGVRWITLLEVTATTPFYAARVEVKAIDEGEETEIAALEETLRDAAEQLAGRLPQEGERAVALLREIDDAGRLADLVIANLPSSVADKAAYAAEGVLADRLRTAIRLVQGELSKG
jgi:Lon protease-like protein